MKTTCIHNDTCRLPVQQCNSKCKRFQKRGGSNIQSEPIQRYDVWMNDGGNWEIIRAVSANISREELQKQTAELKKVYVENIRVELYADRYVLQAKYQKEKELRDALAQEL